MKEGGIWRRVVVCGKSEGRRVLVLEVKCTLSLSRLKRGQGRVWVGGMMVLETWRVCRWCETEAVVVEMCQLGARRVPGAWRVQLEQLDTATSLPLANSL